MQNLEKIDVNTIAIAMSGGVDSSVTAALLHEQGKNVFGITLKLFDDAPAYKAIEDAKKVADQIGIEHHILDCSDDFRKYVIENFIGEYMNGTTPLPCARCNMKIKFGALLDFAKDKGAEMMATGHYIQKMINADGLAELHRAPDHIRDQSYFLFGIKQEQLDFAYFPVGGLHKAETREQAKRFELEVASKPDSQDICFIPSGNYVDAFKQYAPNAITPGKIVNVDGKVVGEHQGIINYTIGQRRGLGIGGGHSQGNQPFFVVGIDVPDNKVIVGDYALLERNKVFIEESNWLVDMPESGLEATVRLRSSMKPQPATVYKNHVLLHNSVYAVASGQACVCYIGERMIGGGWISGAEMI